MNPFRLASRSVASLVLLVALPPLAAADAPPVRDPDARIEIVRDGLGLRLNYTVSAPAGTVRIFAAGAIGRLFAPESVLASIPISGGGSGSLPLTIPDGPTATLYALSWDAGVANPDVAHLVWIPPGRLDLGSPEAEDGRDADEGPITAVNLPRGYFMGRFEVTQGDYSTLMGSNPSCTPGPPELPVDNLTWEEASEFARRLTDSERLAGRVPDGFRFRLPTEAEWEYAARAGTTSRFSHGDDPRYGDLGFHAWFEANSDARSHPVGTREPNPWGIHDMYGNVAEWCLDRYGSYPGGSAVDFQGPSTGDFPVIRGGSFEDEGAFCRSAFRYYQWQTNRACTVGLRLVLAPDWTSRFDSPVELAWVPPGTFLMGSPESEEGRDSDESPRTSVIFTRAFWMGRFEVTQSQFESLMGTNSSVNRGPNLPADHLTWEEAQEFCRRLTRREQAAGRAPTGWEFRLPTEAEWEYVARAGTTDRFSFGDDPGYRELPNHAVFLVAPTLGVGGRAPNPWGVHDMYGNVAEWCADWYGEYAGGTRVDPGGPATGFWRVQRGGSWEDSARHCRSAARGGEFPEDSYSSCGFRVVLAPVPAPPLPPGIELVPIAAGTYLMGSPEAELDSESDEHPQTQVTFAEPFWMGHHEVTQLEYQWVVGFNPSHFANFPEQPVDSVTWEEANEYCRLLTRMQAQAGTLPAGLVYRLPTEAEWEYAARAGSDTRFSFGDDPGYTEIGFHAWFLRNSDFTTHAVGRRPPNPWGLQDMHGNVAEWCWDWYAPYTAIPAANPTGPASGDYRVIRGGSYYDDGEYCRAAFRLIAWNDDRFQNVGFRIVLGRPIPAAQP